MLSDIDEDGVFRLAAAVVKGLPADSPERAEWEIFGRRLQSRIASAPARPIQGKAGRRIGHMDSLENPDDRVVHGRRRRRPSRWT